MKNDQPYPSKRTKMNKTIQTNQTNPYRPPPPPPPIDWPFRQGGATRRKLWRPSHEPSERPAATSPVESGHRRLPEAGSAARYHRGAGAMANQLPLVSREIFVLFFTPLFEPHPLPGTSYLGIEWASGKRITSTYCITVAARGRSGPDVVQGVLFLRVGAETRAGALVADTYLRGSSS